MTDGITPPSLALVIFALLTAICLYIAYKKE